MKMINKAVRLPIAFLAITTLILTGFSGRSMASSPSGSLVFSNAEKHVQIKVEIHGNIDHHTIESVEHLVAEWLEAAHFVISHSEGADVLHLHVKLNVTDNHHYQVHSDCAEWHEDKEAAVVDAIDEILHTMVSHFIEKYSH